MPLLVAAHLLAAAAALGLGRVAGRRALVVLAPLVPALATVALAAQVPDVLDGGRPTWSATWVPGLDVSISFALDGFALLMALVVTGVGTLVLTYSGSYFGPGVDLDRLIRFTGWFLAFGGAMLGLVLADDVWTLFVFWEATSITSFVLIGLDHASAGARAAAQRALLITAAGGLALMGGLVVVTQAAGTTSLAGLAAAPPGGRAVEVALVFVLLGAFTKSAQVPFHIWLPGAMAAPTPVSAYLHSATMVKAGVVLIGRLAPVFADVGWWRPLLVVVGSVTMVLGGVSALRQHDAKLLLAQGTVSQLGLLVVLFGIGRPDVTAAAVAVLLGHALFKAALFLAVGIVDHAAGSRDIRRLTGVGRSLPLVAVLAAIAAASMAGLPPLLGFVAKEAALDALLAEGDAWSTLAVVAVAAGSVLTVAYALRLWRGLFTGTPAPDVEPAEVHHAPSWWLLGPVVVLVGLTVAGGLAAGALGDRLAVVGESLDPDSHGHLVLWAGVKAPLVVSAAIVALGVALHLLLSRRAPLGVARVSGERVFQAGFDGLLEGARRVTGVVQSGSLPAYVAVISSVVAAAGAYGLATGAGIGPRGTVLTDSALQLVVAVLAAAMAVAVVAARRRFVSVLLLGTVGYSLALLFMLSGAPDLALTQVLVETIMLVVFLLVLRHLPEGYAPPPEWAPRGVRVAIAVAVGVGVAGFALAAGTARTSSPVSDAHLALSEPEAHGRNVVNVILVDFRGIDTLGEITVLAVAAVGVANLVRAARRDPETDGDPLGAPSTGDAGSGPEPESIGPRSPVFDQVARLVFPIVLVLSVYVTAKGHNAPGGGFAGGLIAGAAFLMRFLAGGEPPLDRPRALPTSGLIGAGLAVAVATGLGAVVAGGDFLESSIFEVTAPLVGEVKLVTSALFDVGVYLVVLGVVLSMLTHLGAGPGRHRRPAGEARP